MKFRQEFRDISSLSVVLGAAIVAIRGYVAGTGDHLVLSALGVAKANPGTLENDYFLWNSPQPHWAFDLFTEWSARAGVLSAGYFIYWSLAVIALAAGLYFTATAFEFRHKWLGALLTGLLITLGPLSILGTTTVAVPIAIPHMLGAALVVLVTGLVALQQLNWAGFFTVLAAVTHVQHGVIALGVFTVGIVSSFVFGQRVKAKASWWIIPASYVVYYDVTVRPIITNNGDFQYVCEVLVPYHCQVDSWKLERFILGAVTILLALIAAYFGPKLRETKIALTVATGGLAAVSLVSVIAAITGMSALNETLQSLNVYRINAFFIPMAAFGLVLLATQIKRSIPSAVILVIGSWIYLASATDHSALNRYRIVAAFVILALVAIYQTRGAKQLLQLGAVILFAATLVVNHSRTSPTYFSFAASTTQVGSEIAKHVAVDETILMNPRTDWVRVAALRAVVVDCKYKPYGGEALAEFRRRMEPLGGFTAGCPDDSFPTLSTAQLLDYAKEFSATAILLPIEDPRIAELAAANWQIHEVGSVYDQSFVIATAK